MAVVATILGVLGILGLGVTVTVAALIAPLRKDPREKYGTAVEGPLGVQLYGWRSEWSMGPLARILEGLSSVGDLSGAHIFFVEDVTAKSASDKPATYFPVVSQRLAGVTTTPHECWVAWSPHRPYWDTALGHELVHVALWRDKGRPDAAHGDIFDSGNALRRVIYSDLKRSFT